MKCPHCLADGNALVLETRKQPDCIFRRRVCGFCGKSFVSSETASVGMKIPETRDRKKVAGTTTFPTLSEREVFNVWRRS